MLHLKSISPELLELLTQLMHNDVFKHYNLVGGTALALQIGHRISIDIDLFGNCEIDEIAVLDQLNACGPVHVLKKSKNILICSVQGIKVDIVNYSYPILENTLISDGIRMVGLKDIAAMKMNAIAGRGSKKDFIDVYYLLQYFTLEVMIDLYLQKYSNGSEFLVRKSLTFFDDAEDEEMPVMLEDISWDRIKERILEVL
jgi:predicted nucleotidyltransferase component of viral defense system